MSEPEPNPNVALNNARNLRRDISLPDCLAEINNALNYWYPSKYDATKEERDARHVRLFEFRNKLKKQLK